MKKRILSFLLCICTVFCIMPMNAFADNVEGGSCDGIHWEYNSDNGTLTFTGESPLTMDVAFVCGKKDVAKKIVISAGITAVDDYALQRTSSVETLEIAGTVETIGKRAFAGCEKLKDLQIENGVKSISGSAFTECNSLTSVTVPGSVKTIGTYAFESCAKLEKVVLSDGVESIGEQSFSQCPALTDVYLSNTLNTIGNFAFNACTSLKSFNIPASVEDLGAFLFTYDSALESINVDANNPYCASEDGILFNKNKTILIDVPAGKKGTYTVPASVTEIADYSFYYSTLTSVVIPETVVEFGVEIFTYSDITAYVVKGSKAEEYCINNVVKYEYSKPEEYVHTWNSGVKQADGSILYTCTACGATKREKQMNFEDVTPDRYFYEPIKWAYDNDITVGTSPTRFSPDDACTRAQIVTFIWRAKGCPEPKTTKNPFTDVTPANYFYKAVLWAVENGITVGTSATLFSPNAPCTRAQAVTFIWRAENEPSSTVKNPFTDVTADRYFYAPVLWALENGITIGTKPTLFSPDATCTRAQIVTFLYRDVVQNA